MKTIFKIVILLSVFQLKSQTLTLGQIYDYDVGDWIQYSETHFCVNPGSPLPPIMITMSVTGKSLTSTQVTYTFCETRITYTCYPCGSDTVTNYIFPITYNLTDSIWKKWSAHAPTGKLRSDAFSQTCNRTTEKIVFDTRPDVTFEPMYETDTYIKGIGFFYDYTTYKDAVCHYKRIQQQFLLAYKQNGQSCPEGLLVDNQIGNKKELIVFPIPAKDRIQIQTDLNLSYYRIVDINGKVCLNGKVEDHSINVESLKPGEYICAFQTEKSGIITSRIVKE